LLDGNNSVTTVTEQRAGRPGFDPWQGQVFLLTTGPALGPTQPIKWITGVKRPGREADHSPSSSAEVKMSGAILPLPPYLTIAWYLINQSISFHVTQKQLHTNRLQSKRDREISVTNL